jgi:large exoprotein involved in heme utilization and adhesion
LDNVILAGTESGLFANTESGSTGKGGSIFIDPRTLIVRDGARISVGSDGTGTGGDIAIQANSLTLDGGIISAQTASNTGGNISLDVQDLFFLRNGSQISTTAGTAGAGGDGGNINISADFIFAVPQENSDITANAFTGRGGNIQIITQGIFGIEPREKLTPLSDITASSEFGIDGTVTITSPDVDPSRRLVQLPSQPESPEVLQGCRAGGEQLANRFINTGRGGLPPNLDEIDNNTVWEDLRSPTLNADNASDSETVESSTDRPPTQIIEAQGWLVGSDGKIILTAKSATVTPDRSLITQDGCHIP